MPTESGGAERPAQALQEVLEEVLAELPDDGRAIPGGTVDTRWLRIGIRLGLERPEQAGRLLDLIEDPEAHGTTHSGPAAGDASVAELPAMAEPPGTSPVSARSSLLARAAALPASDRESLGPDVRFGWAERLTPSEILLCGRNVHDMVAAGSPPDLGRGFGLAWDAGVRFSHQEREALFHEFTELEVVVGGVLAGRDLRAMAEPAARPRAFGALFDSWMPRKVSGESQAALALERSGEPGQRGLVALWNVWIAMRYRARIPPPTFELLIHPWVAVVGPLPAP